MQALFLITLLAVAVEGIVEYLGAPVPSVYKPYLAAVLAIVVCLGFNADLFFLLAMPAAYPYVGSILTGLIIGRGSNYLNDIISRVGVLPAPATSVDAAEAAPGHG